MLTRQQANVWKLAAILAAGAALRLYHLNHQSLWHDEAISVIVGRAPLDQTLNYFRAQPGRLPFEYNPPLYAYLLHVWFAIFGVSDFAARLLSAAAGILCLPVIYVLAADLFGRPAGRNAALLLAVSQLGVMFSQEARNYEVFLLLTLVTSTLYWRSLSRKSLQGWCACTVSAILMVLTNYYGVFVILALALYTLLYWRNVPLAWVGGAALAGATALVPWIWTVLRAQVTAASDRVQPEYFAVGLTTIAGTINRFSNGAVAGLLESTPPWTFAVGALLFGGPLLVLVAGAFRRDRATAPERRLVVFALLLWLVPLASVLAAGFALNVQFNVRYVAFCIAPYYILVGAGLATMPGTLARTVVLAAIVVYSGVALAANYRVPYKENFRDAIAFITPQEARDDCYAFVPFGGPPLEWSIYSTHRPERLLKPDAASAAGCRRIWVITYERVVTPVHARWQAALAEATAGLTKQAERSFFWVRVEEYER